MYKILSNSGKRVYGVKAYMVKTVADIDAIPLLSSVAPGSTVIVTETSEKYILSQERIWVPVKKPDQSGGDDSPGDSTDETIYEGGDLDSGDTKAVDVDYEGGEV